MKLLPRLPMKKRVNWDHFFIMNKSWFKVLLQWTNKPLYRKGWVKNSFPKFMAYIRFQNSVLYILEYVLLLLKDRNVSMPTRIQQSHVKMHIHNMWANAYLHITDFFNHEVASWEWIFLSVTLLANMVQVTKHQSYVESYW